MRRLLSLLLLAALPLGNIGCVVVLGAEDFRCQPSVVEIDGKLYAVDVEDGSARRISVDLEQGCAPVKETEVEPLDD
jgi:hypothetical protein